MRFAIFCTVLALLVLGVFLAGDRPASRPTEVASPPPSVEEDDGFDEAEWAFFLEDDEEDDAPLVLAVQVLDVYDERPVPDLRFRLERSTVGEAEGPLEVVTDAEGRFEMPWTSVSAIVPLTEDWAVGTSLRELYEERVLRVHRQVEVVVQLRAEDGFDPGTFERAWLMTTPYEGTGRARRAVQPPLFRSKPLPWPRFDTDGRASFVVRGSSAGPVLVWHPEAYVTPIRPDVSRADGGRVVVVATLRPRPLLHGRVVDDEGEPVPHAWVGIAGEGEAWHAWFGDWPPLPDELATAREPSGDTPLPNRTFARFVQADDEGRYAARLPAPGMMLVRVSAGPKYEETFERVGEVGPKGLERDLVLRPSARARWNR